MDFKIVNIEKHHKNKIHKLIEEINLEDNLKYSLTDEWLDYVIENAREGIFLAFHEDRLAGMATSMINPVYKDQGTLNVVVSPKYRKKGLGTMLYKAIYDFTKKENVKIVESYVKGKLDYGLRFAEKRKFNISMYSWEMELTLDSFDFKLKELAYLNFRKANKKDGLIYKNIIFDAFKDQIGEDAIIQALEDPSIIIYILEKNNKALGSATVQVKKDLNVGYIYDIAILKEYRGQGLGSYLIESCLRDLKKKNIDKASLLVIGENKRALELYRKIGFKEVDIDLIMVKYI